MYSIFSLSLPEPHQMQMEMREDHDEDENDCIGKLSVDGFSLIDRMQFEMLSVLVYSYTYRYYFSCSYFFRFFNSGIWICFYHDHN